MRSFISVFLILICTFPALSQETTPIDINFHFRDGGCFNDQRERGRNSGAMVECGGLKGRVAFGLYGVDLNGFFGQYLWMQDLNFMKVRFHNTRFELAKIEHTKITESEIFHSDWRGALINKVKFEKTRFQNTDFRGVKMNDVTFKDCDLTNVNFEGATFFRVRFHNTRTEKLNMNLVSKSFVSGLEQ